MVTNGDGTDRIVTVQSIEACDCDSYEDQGQIHCHYVELELFVIHRSHPIHLYGRVPFSYQLLPVEQGDVNIRT